MTRLFAAAVAFAFLALASVDASAAEKGNVSSPSLARMGYASVRTLSDAEGMNIRGQGVPVALSGGTQIAHGALSAFVFNLNIAKTGSRSAQAFSFGVALGRSF